MAEQEDERHVGGPGPVRHGEHLPLDGFQGGPARDAGGERLVLRQPRDGLANTEPLVERVEKRLGFRPELLGVLGRASEAGDDEHVGPRRGGGRLGRGREARKAAGAERGRGTQRRGERDGSCAAHHARSFRRRYAHSPPSKPARSRKRIGMSHSERSSYTVSPLSV